MVIFVIGRLVPGIRTTLFLTAGTTRLALWKFILADGAGALVGTTLFFLLGYGLGAQFQELIERLENKITPHKPILFILLLLAVAGFLIYRYLRQPIPTGDPEEVPLIGHQIATHLPDHTGEFKVVPPQAPCDAIQTAPREEAKAPSAEQGR
jgi:hypothetical protein